MRIACFFRCEQPVQIMAAEILTCGEEGQLGWPMLSPEMNLPMCAEGASAASRCSQTDIKVDAMNSILR